MTDSFTFKFLGMMQLLKLQILAWIQNLSYSKPVDGLLETQAETPVETPVKTSVTSKNALPEKQSSNYEVPRPIKPPIIYVTDEESQQIADVANRLIEDYGTLDDNRFIEDLHLRAYKLMPERIVKVISDFAMNYGYDQYGTIILSNLIKVDQIALGSTPLTYEQVNNKTVLFYGFVSALIHAAARAYPIQQYYQREGGGYLHSVIPNSSKAYTQTGEAYKTPLALHTEDACLNSRADFLSFLYLRNEEETPSFLHSIRSHDISQPYMEKLFLPIYKFPLDANYDVKDKVISEKTVPVLDGNPVWPFMRFDAGEQLTKEANQSPEAFKALNTFVKEANDLTYKEYKPYSGDMVFVNNRIASHGRNNFEAGFKLVNGTLVPCEKRWMVRMMSVSDLMNFYKYSIATNPFFGIEKQFDDLFPIS